MIPVGADDGMIEGFSVGKLVGGCEGELLGICVGGRVGDDVGVILGALLGARDGYANLNRTKCKEIKDNIKDKG